MVLLAQQAREKEMRTIQVPKPNASRDCLKIPSTVTRLCVTRTVLKGIEILSEKKVKITKVSAAAAKKVHRVLTAEVLETLRTPMFKPECLLQISPLRVCFPRARPTTQQDA